MRGVKSGVAYEAKEKVWNVLSQSWSAFPRSSLRRGIIFMLPEEDWGNMVVDKDARRA